MQVGVVTGSRTGGVSAQGIPHGGNHFKSTNEAVTLGGACDGGVAWAVTTPNIGGTTSIRALWRCMGLLSAMNAALRCIPNT